MPDRFDMSKIRDFAYYAPSLLRIKTNIPGPTGKEVERIIPFTFNESQWKLHRVWEHQLATVGYVRIIILKARRQGMSTYLEGRGFHKDVTNANTHGFIIAHDKDSTNTIFDMSKLFYEALPKQYKPMKRYSSKKELVFENPNERTRFDNPGLRSKIEVFTAGKVGASRSGGYSWAHFSEVAFFDNAEELISGTAPTIPDIPGSFIVYESTAYGRGGFFHEEWLKATSKKKRKETNFVPIFFSWLEFASYSKPFNDGCQKKDLLGTLDPEEKMLYKKFHATTEQLHWRRHKILDLSDDLDLFHQEYPTTPDEAFISAGQSYFNRRKVTALLDLCIAPETQGEVSTGRIVVEDSEGPLQIWEHPLRDAEYMIGVDVGGGSDDGDPSCMEVVKVPRGVPVLEQVAEWHDVCDPVVLAGRAIGLATYYNMATIAPEINNHGLTTLNEIKTHYYNIYRWQYFDRYGKALTNKLGWECVDPEAEILTADLQLVKAKDLNVGDLLVGCDESLPSTSRRLRNQVVVGLKTFRALKLKISFVNGTFTIVSDNHPFLCHSYNEYWLEAKDIIKGTQIKYIPKVVPLRTYEAGRLSGLLDGEGHIAATGTRTTTGNRCGLQMAITQVVGPLADEIDDLWEELGFVSMKKYNRRFDDRHRQEMCTMGLYTFGDIVRALSLLRPTRLLRNFVEGNLIECNTVRSFGNLEVASIEQIGAGEVLGIETNGHTLVVDGLISHNTNMSTRPLLCDYTSACVNANILVIRSRELVEEMLSFIKRASVGGEADSGCHDDRIMAFMITIFCLAHSYQSASMLRELGLYTEPIVTETKHPTILTPTDHDLLAEVAMEERMEYFRGESAWLNY